MLCVACFMPSDESSTLPESTSKERTALGRYLFDKLTSFLHPRTLPDAKHVFDDALTAFIMTSISPSEQSVESSLHYWLAFLKFVVQELQVYKALSELTEDEREERRRLWWATFIIDRHVALSFNERPYIPDQECQLLPIPSPDTVWVMPGRLLSTSETLINGNTIGYRVISLDMLGIYLPLSKILGEILEHRFICEHPTFNKNKAFLAEIKSNILTNLGQWYESFSLLVGRDFPTIANPECDLSPPPEVPKVAYYGLHMYHCMFILLHGPMDIVRMYKDHTWQSSMDFLTAGEHAAACANVARYILRVDPRLCLMYRFFGTYFLQSTFIFLILAQKLGRQSDELIMRNCAINLQVLDRFVATTNMDYQHTFAKFIRRALSYNMGHLSPEHDMQVDNPLSESLDPEMLAYRWIPGYRGLHVGPSGKE
ncbi:NmrA-like family protein [Penicillium malachiteum]|uniref:NmrA-like family protein n=1 Tax=Penicillium malachiteum TaxID=1324776 RepID=A0AAD6HNQ6_9EURO|nr:NmrA-like family protein [Penicillium malachiteum]